MSKLLKRFLFSSLLFILHSTLFILHSNAQINIIQDGSFEDTTTNWENVNLYSGEGILKNWHSIVNDSTATPWNYMSIYRTIDLGLKLPNCGYIRHYPHTGGGGCFFYNYFPVISTNSFHRSIMRSPLHNKLIAGKQYCAKIYVVASFFYGVYTNGLSLYFDNGQLDTIYTIHHDSSGVYPFVHPQVTCSFVVNDTLNWMKIQGSFTANGTETYVTLGNFLKDTDIVKQYNSWGYPEGQLFLIDDASLIPIDLHDWLHDTTIAFTGDSVYIGLDKLDYAEGKWYTYGMQLIDSGTGFMFKPEASITKFIQGVEVCGVMRYDTMTVYAYPLNLPNPSKGGALRVYPNPASNRITIEGLDPYSKEPINIYDVYGRKIKEWKVENGKLKTEVDVSNFSKGIYYLKVGSNYKKIIIE